MFEVWNGCPSMTRVLGGSAKKEDLYSGEERHFAAAFRRLPGSKLEPSLAHFAFKHPLFNLRLNKGSSHKPITRVGYHHHNQSQKHFHNRQWIGKNHFTKYNTRRDTFSACHTLPCQVVYWLTSAGSRFHAPAPSVLSLNVAS